MVIGMDLLGAHAYVYECGSCGQELDADFHSCPSCDGDVTVHVP